MKALATLRHALLITLFAMAAATASAAEGEKKERKAPPYGGRPARREVAAFVDPTAPLGELVKKISTQN